MKGWSPSLNEARWGILNSESWVLLNKIRDIYVPPVDVLLSGWGLTQ